MSDSRKPGALPRNVDLVEATTRAADDARDDRPPSLRFRILFTAAMLLIAIGYAWVWQVKTERVVAEAAPILALDSVVSYMNAGPDGVDVLGPALLAQLRAIPGLTVVDARGGRPAGQEVAQSLVARLDPGGRGRVLDMRRTDARSGDVLYRHRVEGATLDEAVYRMSVQIAMSFGLPRPQPLGDTTARRP